MKLIVSYAMVQHFISHVDPSSYKALTERGMIEQMVKEYNSALLATRRENGRSINPLSAIVLFCKRLLQIASPKRIGFSCESLNFAGRAL